MKRTILISLMLLAALPITFAWSGDTHEYLAQEVCNSFEECVKCVDYMKNASTIPDAVYHDTVNHHVYKNCVASTKSWCEIGKDCQDCSQGSMTDDIAIKQMNIHLTKALNYTDCRKWVETGIASHYFFDSKVFFHQTKYEQSDCHSKMERDVNTNIKNGVYNFTINTCGVDFDSDQLTEDVNEFKQLVSDNTNLKIVEPIKKEEDYTLYIFAIGVIAFVIFGVGSKRI